MTVDEFPRTRRKTIAVLTSVRDIRDRYFEWARPVWQFAAERYRAGLDPYKRARFAIRKAYHKAAPSPPDQLHVSWSGAPSTSLDAIWHTAVRDDSAGVRVRSVGDSRWETIRASSRSSPGLGFIHKAHATGLRPDTVYQYQVISQHHGPTSDHTYVTKTAPDRSSPLTFAFVCDIGIPGRRDGLSEGVEPIVSFVEQDNPDFVIAGGDYAYANRDFRFKDTQSAIDAFFHQMQPLFSRYPTMFAYGNHEIFHDERHSDWSPRFSLPTGPEGDKYYSFDVGDVHFVCLFVPGSRHCEGPSEKQLLWLEGDLKRAREGGAKWLIAYQHDAVFACGSVHPSKERTAKRLGPIFEKYGLDLHLSGHDQSFERTFPLRNIAEEPEAVSTDLHTYRKGEGVIYAKISPSGKVAGPEYEQNPETARDFYFSDFTQAQQAFMAVRDSTAHHYGLFTVKENGVLEAQIYQVFGDRKTRQLVDHFQISARQDD